MTKISEIINFHSAYGEQVRLHEYFYNEHQNVDHMTGYVPIRSHREVFLQLAKSQLHDKENKEKVFMLTGSFGTGKSHLCLMLANYFSMKPTDDAMKIFFENWIKRDKSGAENIRNWRGDGRYLVAPCEFGEAKPFEDMILSAIQEALEYDGAEDVILQTHFEAAIRLLNTWKDKEKSGEPVGLFRDFLRYLGGDEPDESLEELINGLETYESTSMKLFQETYEKATTQKMTFRNDSLLAILRNLLASGEFQKRYKGLVILADEFGYALSENRVKLSVFQDFAEMSKDGIAGMDLIFIGTGHRRFAAYGADSQLQIDFRVVQDRVTEVSLQSEELEQIISSLVSPKTDSAEWQKSILEKNIWLLSQMAGNAKKLNLFNYLSEPEVLDQLVKNIYPVHPIATYCLTKMSQELGSDARSVFSFFREYGTQIPVGGYAWYVKTYDVNKPDGELNILTPDILLDFFNEGVTSSNLTVRPEVREHIRAYSAAVDEAKRFAYKDTLTKEIDEFTNRILKTIFVYKVSDLPVNDQVIEYGLNLSKPAEKRMLQSEIKSLIKNKIIFKLPSGEYELRRTSTENIPELLSEAVNAVLQEPFNLSDWAISLAPHKWENFCDAKGHNQETDSDRRMFRVFATYHDLDREYILGNGQAASFWDYLEEQRLQQTTWRNSYEGIMVYVICEDEEDIKLSKQSAKNFRNSERYSKLDYQEQAILDEILGKENQKTGYYGDFINIRSSYTGSDNLYWLRQGGKTHLGEPTNEYEPADIFMNRQYTNRTTIAHDYLNKVHPKSFSGSRDSALREAIVELTNINRPVRIDSSQAQNKGEIRYLLRALKNHGVLVQTGDYSASIAEYAIENKVDKYQKQYPALVELISTLKELEPGNSFPLGEIINQLIQAPYGIGPYALSIFFGCVVRYFGDELRLKINKDQPGYSQTDDPDVIIDVSTGKYQMASVERREINPATAKLINGIYNEFSESPAKAGSQQTLNETWRSLKEWWRNLTNLERSIEIYTENSSTHTFADVLSRLSQENSAAQCFLDDILVVFGYNSDVALKERDTKEILNMIKQVRLEIEEAGKNIKLSLIQNVGTEFDSTGDTYKDHLEAVHAWFENLHPEQKQINAEWQTPLSKAIIEATQMMQDIEKTFLEVIPSSGGLGSIGKVDDWTSDNSQRYLALLREGLEQIRESLPKVPLPIWKADSDPGTEYGGIIPVKFHGSLNLDIKSPKQRIKVRISKNEDPRKSKQFITLEPDAKKSIVVEESCSYFFVAENDQGDFSRVIHLNLTNLDEEYRLIIEPSPKLDPEDRTYRFRNPVEKQGLKVLLVDIFDHIQEEKRITKKEIIKILEELIVLLSQTKK